MDTGAFATRLAAMEAAMAKCGEPDPGPHPDAIEPVLPIVEGPIPISEASDGSTVLAARIDTLSLQLNAINAVLHGLIADRADN